MPWRGLAIGAVVVAVIAGVALAIMVPRINETKEVNAERAAAEKARVLAAHRARVIRNQRPRTGAAAALAPAANSTPEEREGARASLLDRVEADIFADAKARSARGELRPVIGPTTCERAVATPTSGPLGVFDCFVVTTRIKATERNLPGALGYPFRAVLDYSDFSYYVVQGGADPGREAGLHARRGDAAPAGLPRPEGLAGRVDLTDRRALRDRRTSTPALRGGSVSRGESTIRGGGCRQ